MKRKGKESKLNAALTSMLVVFVSLLAFSIGVITGKDWSDRDNEMKFFEKDSHVKAAKEDQGSVEDDMTEKEVGMLTQRALEQAKAEESEMKFDEEESEVSALDKMATEADRDVASKDQPEKSPDEKPAEVKKQDQPEKQEPKGREASTAENKKDQKPKRKVSSVPPQVTTPKPAAIDYTVQVAAYKTSKEAEDHSLRLSERGFPAYPVEATIKGKTWYRVSISSFKSYKEAVKYRNDLEKQGVVKNSIVQKIKRLKK